MSGITYYLFALFMAGVLVWQFISGRALGTWWYPKITRQDNPGAYWFVVAAQGAILLAFLLTGKTWHVR
jgi:hypothetical protein